MSANPHEDRRELCPEDQSILDALVEQGFDREAIESFPPEAQARAETIGRMFELLNDYPVEDGSEELVYATLARIDQHERRMALAMEAQDESPSRIRRFRLPDFISVAAVFLIGASVFWPLITNMKQRSIDASCANNLRLLGFAFGNYANEYDGAMPVARAGFSAGWDNRFQNVINLAPLVENGFCEHGNLDCPGHDGVGDSYSYQWQIQGARPTWGDGRTSVILGDRNPIIDAARAGRLIPATSLSANHGGRGQNVLTSDSAHLWLTQPVISRKDNIWLPHGLDHLESGDAPADAADVFLAH